MYCDLPAVFVPSEYRVKQATQRWEFEQAYALRREVFCVEQQVFADDDRDEIDAQARLLVAVACVGGVLDQVVGTVRIHEARPGVWWGSRLAVHRAFRRHVGLGTTLIRLAVGTAHARGCKTFLAHVQQQNVELFKRLHWHWLADEMLCGRPHCLMSAEVGWYAPCHDPAWGLAVHDGKPTAQRACMELDTAAKLHSVNEANRNTGATA
jgi:putative N-acetyltransferase (TIGR04045 family)